MDSNGGYQNENWLYSQQSFDLNTAYAGASAAAQEAGSLGSGSWTQQMNDPASRMALPDDRSKVEEDHAIPTSEHYPGTGATSDGRHPPPKDADTPAASAAEESTPNPQIEHPEATPAPSNDPHALLTLFTGIRTIPPPTAEPRKILVKSSIPPTVESAKYIQECEAAAVASRLPPNLMSPEETAMMREHLSHLQITTYLITRNAILRLWIKNPMLWVSIEEAQGVAREERHFLLCRHIWEFLVRNGYINFGCLEIPETKHVDREQKEILVIGAGVAGLSAARQIQTLLSVFQDKLSSNYNVTILEGRSRIGGRVYSHELKHRGGSKSESSTSRVDLGAQIVTGFSGGNPLTILLQRQLAFPSHSLIHARNNKIHGHDGKPIEHTQDVRVEGLFNLLLDAAARFRYTTKDEVEDNREIANGLQESDSDVSTSPKLELVPETTAVAVADKVLGVGKAIGKDAIKAITSEPLEELRRLGFTVPEDAVLEPIEKAESLGKTMNNILHAYCAVASISELDQDILRWHWANMEYACGTNLDNLSLTQWDQDDGNEFRGHHAMMIGGYSQLARGLALAPTKLNVRTNATVDTVAEFGVLLNSGEPLPASKVVVSVPLGVLKQQKIEFRPPLPDWKLDAIKNLGFGLLNKVVLVYGQQFWEEYIDLLGTLPTKSSAGDVSDRGRFYMFWNCTAHASGKPVLIALMAGDAALACENTSNEVLVTEATQILQRIYPDMNVPAPEESIITRWGSDPYAFGSYSYIGPDGTGADYEDLSKPIGEHWFFAGEATCRTHPSTVHGAYLSGLSAAKAVVESIIGEQHISPDVPLIPIKSKPGVSYTTTKSESKKRKFETFTESGDKFLSIKDKVAHLKKQRASKEKEALEKVIQDRIGPRPEQPKRTNANPFLIFQKDQWNVCRLVADQAQQKKNNNPEAKATKNQIRACLGTTWRETSEEGRKPWIDIVNQRKLEYDSAKETWDSEHAKWEEERLKVIQWFDENERPSFVTEEETLAMAAIADEEQPQMERKQNEVSATTDELKTDVLETDVPKTDDAAESNIDHEMATVDDNN